MVGPEQQVRVCADATQEALAAGFTGLLVVADVTPLVSTPARLEAFARYEHLVDCYMATHPLAGMCAYDRVQLGDAAVAQVACLHPGPPQAPPRATCTPTHRPGPPWPWTVTWTRSRTSCGRRRWTARIRRLRTAKS
ncbi:MEDS domain-containing protein [Saccharothrix sp. S26]|nr:MEDS domain-containing protein [Saccharothrix sp. S26]MCE6995451.1 MEDS domain-containing protein [Saccharothrix sp. S26]